MKIDLAARAPISNNVHRARIERGMTLGGLTESSGIGNDTLRKLETGADTDMTATIATVWRLARALGLSFGDLIDHAAADGSPADGLEVRLIDQQSGTHKVESYLMKLAPNATRKAEPHGAGVTEHIVMLNGAMIVGAGTQPVLLNTGQSHAFDASTPHVYQSLDRHATAMVTVVYPTLVVTAGDFDIRKTWPHHEDQWQGVAMQLARLQLEAAQGVGAFRMQFDECDVDPQQAVSELARRLSDAAFMSPICIFVILDQMPTVVGFPRPHGHATLADGAAYSPLLKTAIHTVNRSVAPARILSHAEADALQRQSKGDVLVLAALAAEVLTRHGVPCVPAGLMPRLHVAQAAAGSTVHVAFEDRIDVNAYATYELLHPAYAKQSVAIAQIIGDLQSDRNLRLLEIGTGPGTSLQLLLELAPALEVVAVEPSAMAFAHLSNLFKDDRRVVAEQSSITELGGKYDAFDIAVSVGASHHLNTSHFLQSTHANLKPHALFIVADEMIAPFGDARQRRKNLIAHHLQYIADTLVSIDIGALTDPERQLIERMQTEVPAALYEAHAGLAEAAAYRCGRLSNALKHLTFPEPASDPLVAFYRFHYLELEALMAGLDYEVEQKTYPARFLDLALHAGFELVGHRRLYATHGDAESDAGTHLFVLRALP